MERRTNLDRQFAISLAGLVVLIIAGVVLGLILANPRTGTQLGVVLLSALVVLALFGVVAYFVAHRPLQMLARREQELRRLTTTDSLTGLLSRTEILKRLEREASRARRAGEPLSCAVVDIDEMAKINEKFGQVAGDGLLRSVGSLIAETCRQYDSAGRIGGTEFLLALPGTELDDAARAAERLRQRIEASEFACHGEGFSVTASLGVTQTEMDTAESINDLIRRASDALRRAKNEGRNRVCATTPLSMMAPQPPPTTTPVPG